MADTLAFLAKAVAVSLTGVMAPGAMTAAALAAGTRRRHAGAMIAVGHGIVELPLIVLLIGGVRLWLERAAVRGAIGLAGGVIMLWMALGLLRALRGPALQADAVPQRRPVRAGIVLTATNPFFLLWWATVGLTLAADAARLGAAAFALFALVHWVCDLLWLEILTLASFSGARLLGPSAQKAILLVCGAGMAWFGAQFVASALGDMGLLRHGWGG
ncbi:MAG: LysE family transporter [Planctomycetes bacterium]|nr:LysE family transporter [Planctomycetota bacterium]